MSSTVAGEARKSLVSTQAVVSSEQSIVRSVGDAGGDYAPHVSGAWSIPLPAQYPNIENQPQPPLLQESCQSEESVDTYKLPVVGGARKTAVETKSYQDDSTSWAAGGHDRRVLSADNLTPTGKSESSGLVTSDEIRWHTEGYEPIHLKEALQPQPSEAAVGKNTVETPLFGPHVKDDAPPGEESRPASLEKAAQPPEADVSRPDFSRRPPSSAAGPAQPGSHSARPARPTTPDKSPCQRGALLCYTETLIPSEHDALSNDRGAPAADVVDAYEGGNVQVCDSPWCLSLSTSSDTHSDTHHVRQSLGMHSQGSSSRLQEPIFIPIKHAPREEAVRTQTHVGTGVDAALPSMTTKNNCSRAAGLRDAGKDSEGEKDDLSSEADAGCQTYGRAKVATDMLAGLTGMQPVAIINCFVSNSPLGGVLSMFCLFSSGFAHYDKRPASYFLCSLLAFFLGITLIIAVCSELPGFEAFHSEQLLRRMSVAHATVLLLTSLIAGGLGGRAALASTARGESKVWGKCLKPL